jgi:hypothetical protein
LSLGCNIPVGWVPVWVVDGRCDESTAALVVNMLSTSPFPEAKDGAALAVA